MTHLKSRSIKVRSLLRVCLALYFTQSLAQAATQDNTLTENSVRTSAQVQVQTKEQALAKIQSNQRIAKLQGESFFREWIFPKNKTLSEKKYVERLLWIKSHLKGHAFLETAMLLQNRYEALYLRPKNKKNSQYLVTAEQLGLVVGLVAFGTSATLKIKNVPSYFKYFSALFPYAGLKAGQGAYYLTELYSLRTRLPAPAVVLTTLDTRQTVQSAVLNRSDLQRLLEETALSVGLTPLIGQALSMLSVAKKMNLLLTPAKLNVVVLVLSYIISEGLVQTSENFLNQMSLSQTLTNGEKAVLALTQTQDPLMRLNASENLIQALLNYEAQWLNTFGPTIESMHSPSDWENWFMESKFQEKLGLDAQSELELFTLFDWGKELSAEELKNWRQTAQEANLSPYQLSALSAWANRADATQSPEITLKNILLSTERNYYNRFASSLKTELRNSESRLFPFQLWLRLCAQLHQLNQPETDFIADQAFSHFYKSMALLPTPQRATRH